MTEGLIGTIIVCVTVLALVGLICWTKIVTSRNYECGARHETEGLLARHYQEKAKIEAAHPPQSDRHLYTSAGTTQGGFESEFTYGRSEQPVTETQDLSKMDPLPIDPNNKPRVLRYKPKSAEPPPRCICHQEPVREGQFILWWPIPDSGGVVKVFCQPGREITP